MEQKRKITAFALSVPFLLSPCVAHSAAKQFRALTNTGILQVTDNAPHALPLTHDGATSKTVKLGGGALMVSFNAECMAQGPDGSYMSISILVDGVPTDPDSGTNFAFCSPTGPSSHTFTAVVRNGVTHVAGGTHTFQVIGTGINTTLWQVQDTILTIVDF